MYMYEQSEFYLVGESEPLEHNTDPGSHWETKT